MSMLRCLALLVCIINVRCGEVTQNLLEESEINVSLSENIVLYGIITELAKQSTNVSATCAADLTNILRGINKHDMWAVKVMDASGTFEKSFVWGQNAWVDSKQSCDFLNQAPQYTISPDIPKLMDKHLISTLSQMEMDFKMIFMNIVSPYKVDATINVRTTNTNRLGLCLPKSCSNQDIECLSKNFFSGQKLNFQRFYNATIEVINVRNMDIHNFLGRSEVLGVFCAICIVIALPVLLNFANSHVQKTNRDGLKRFLKCFSINDNFASIYKTDSSPNSINSLNGLRTVICVWVLLIHCGFFSMYAYDNRPVLMASLERFEIQPVFSIEIYVDVFFVLSGLLLVYNFLKDERTLTEVRSNTITDNAKLFLKKIANRYIRLTPVFIFTCGLGHILAIYIQESSSFYIDETFDTYCPQHAFWNSVFYIHNLFKVQDSCLTWSWYIACDMQFYIIILFVLFVHARKPVTAKAMFFVLFAALTAIVIYLDVDMNLLPRLDSLFYHGDDFFIEPWNRMHPYLAGCTVGYIMFRMKGRKFSKSRHIIVLYWTITAVIFVGTLFITYFRDLSAFMFALGLSVGRYAVGLFVGSWVVMCHIGYGGIVNTLLSNRFFVHLNKVSYVVYLMHPIFVIFFSSTQESSPHFDTSSLAIFTFGIALLSYIVAVVLSAMIELPFQKLSDEYIMRKSDCKLNESNQVARELAYNTRLLYE